MGSVSTDREEMWGQRNKSRQEQLQAAEIWAGSEKKLLPEMPGEGGEFRHLCAICYSADAFPGASP